MAIPPSAWTNLDDEARSALLARPAVAADGELQAMVAAILDRVRLDGDAALREYTERFDGVSLDEFAVSDEELQLAAGSLPGAALRAIDTAIANVRRFHEQQLPKPLSIETMPGVLCERITHPIDAVGLYVPAGTAPLPSAAIMLAVPAAIAACPTRILCTPPRPDGLADPGVLVAASRAGIERIYKLGGAQAIAAMAYGSESIPAVNKIFGPGNAWVTMAKSMVSADARGAAIDMPAGPSEVLVIADSTANAAFVAADLLSQAEHGIDSQVILITDSDKLAADVQARLSDQLASLERKDIAAGALAHSRIILVGSVDEAIEISNNYAPEHLILQCENPSDRVGAIRNAGSVFVGPWTPESVGDYCSGTNHVLPTYGYARSYSGLGVDQFLRAMTVQKLTRDGLAALSETVITLAELEGLDAHAAAVSIRMQEAV